MRASVLGRIMLCVILQLELWQTPALLYATMTVTQAPKIDPPPALYGVLYEVLRIRMLVPSVPVLREEAEERCHVFR